MSSSLMLTSNDDGNLYLPSYSYPTLIPAQDSMLFSSYALIVASDYQSRIFIYYPSTISYLGVSRLRLVSDSYIPSGRRVITLTPLAISSQPSGGIYVASDTPRNAYQWAWCTMVDTAPKVMDLGR